MRREIYEDIHEEFRTVARGFVQREVVPNLARWDEQHAIDRSTWRAAGELGLIGVSAPESHGGMGETGYLFRSVFVEELALVGAASLASSFSLHDDIVIPYIVDLGTAEQHARWLPKMSAGELIGAIAMTEPGAGSDLKAIATTAVRAAGGWVLNGAKTFITSGIQADLVIVVARTEDEGRVGHTLLVVERDAPGFARGRRLEKIGLHAQDTAELFFDDVFVPDSNVLGAVGAGFGQLMDHLPLERLAIAVQGLCAAEAVFAQTIAYVDERHVFGKPIADFQYSRFALAEMSTELDVTRSYVDQCLRAYDRGELTAVDAAKAKWWATDLQGRVVDRCLQMHGGYGYMSEYPVARAFIDARVQRIFGGANEIMKEIIGRDLIGRR